MSDKKILVVADTNEFVSEHILQILSKARSLAEHYRSKVAALCVGTYRQERLETLLYYGAHYVFLFECNRSPSMGGVCDILASVIRQHEPAVVLFPATDWGKAVAAKLSVRLDVGLTADCIDVTLEDDFSFYRTAMNQTMLAKIRYINCNIRMGTIKKDVFVKKTWEYGTTGKIETFPTLLSNDDLDHSFLEILECVQIPQKIGMDLEKVSIAFCVGRGVKKKETCDRISQLAMRCGAGIIGTRAAVEMGLIEKERQIGQSGNSIAPKIYLGFGVSGASQHIVGIKNADLIIAVNTDKKATIFDYADYQIIEDLEDVIAEMEKQLLLVKRERSIVV